MYIKLHDICYPCSFLSKFHTTTSLFLDNAMETLYDAETVKNIAGVSQNDKNL